MSAKSRNIPKFLVSPFIRMLRHSRFLPLCFLAFVAIRLAIILLIPIADPFSDSGWYLERARTLIEKGTYSEGGLLTAYWPIGYPAFLAALFKVTGTSILVAQLANLVLAAASFWLLYFIVRNFLHDELIARASVLLLAVYPNNAAYVPIILTETLYTFLLLTACFFLLRNKQWVYVLVAGTIFGLATLVKTQTILLIPVIAFLAYFDAWSFRSGLRATIRAGLVLAVALAVVTPWGFRNLNVFGHFVLSTNGGTSLLAGNNPSVVGDYSHDYSDTDPLFEQVKFSAADQMNADKRARVLAVNWIKDNTGQFVGLMPKKLFRLWAPDGEAEWMYQDTPFYKRHTIAFRAVRIINQAFYVLMLILFSLACWKLLTRRAAPVTYLGIAIVLVYTLISIVFSGQSRYHFPAMPFVLAYAAWAFIGLTNPETSNGSRPVNAIA